MSLSGAVVEALGGFPLGAPGMGAMLGFCRIMITSEEGAMHAAARELFATLDVPMFVVDRAGNLVFYNEAAGETLGLPFYKAGEMSSVQWSTAFEPTDSKGTSLGPQELPLVIALDERRPASRRMWIKAVAQGRRREIDVTAFPMIGRDGRHHGAMTVFWEVKGRDPEVRRNQ